MIHVTCDLCGKDLRPGEDQHFVVKIDVRAAHDPNEITEDDLDNDLLEEVSQVLKSEASALAELDDEPAQRSLRFDLCDSCHKRFLKDPLGREASLNFNFSEN